jgi:N-acetylglutamate synthase-like GNAT family acetyltransferase
MPRSDQRLLVGRVGDAQSLKPSPRAMNFVDLGGRQDEPAVRRLLAQSHGTAEALEEACAHYRSGEWTFIGWQEREEIFACAGAEKLSSGTIGIRSIAVAPEWRNRGLGRTLIDALAKLAGAKRVVAETDDDAVGFYRRCGFAVEDAPPKFGHARYMCVRDIST